MPGTLSQIRQFVPAGSTASSSYHVPSTFYHSTPSLVFPQQSSLSTCPFRSFQPSLTPASDPLQQASFFNPKTLRKSSPSPTRSSPTCLSFRASADPSSPNQHSPLVSISQVPSTDHDRISSGPLITEKDDGRVPEDLLEVKEVEGALIIQCELAKFSSITLEIIINDHGIICINVDRWELDAQAPGFLIWDGSSSRFVDRDISALIRRTDVPVLFQRRSVELISSPVRMARRVVFDSDNLSCLDVPKSEAHFTGSTLRVTIPRA